ncbi:transcription factor MYB101 [Lycium barbarum]|uniref:transcription factor MYB101 n=1 Tax=Lycium barbarum TaxID=112863 RepID=UPI00293EF612|nr:transcription factor MYB101 [Lycium barbarum]
MAPDDRGMKNGGGRSGGGNRHALKKGPWTATEDAILMEYVKKQGEGNWNAVQRNSGLMRCGKSCRLRWANHLRPNLKKGAFSPEEERIIIELHAKLGNKWARMAAQLPGRTDNEIKNYWNTRLKRRQRAGLPIYPQELQSQNQQENNQTQSLISSPYDPQRATYNNTPSLSLLDIFNPSTMKPPMTHQFPLNSNNIFRDPPKGLSLTIPSSMRNSQISSLPTSVANNNFGHGLSNSMPVPSFQQNYPNFSLTTRPFMGIPSNQNGLISGMGINSIDYPSRQSSMPVTTASSSENTGSDFGSSDANNYANVAGLSRGNSGLLEDLLEESQALTRPIKIEENNYIDLKEEADYKGKSLWEDYGFVEEETGDQDEAILTEESVYSFAHGGDVTLNNNSESSSPDPHSSSGIFMRNEVSLQGINQVDEDIMCLLDNFPQAVPVPDWYDETDDKNNSNGKSSNIGTDAHKAENQAEDSSKSQVVITTSSGPKNHDLELGGCCWNNMPSFC